MYRKTSCSIYSEFKFYYSITQLKKYNKFFLKYFLHVMELISKSSFCFKFNHHNNLFPPNLIAIAPRGAVSTIDNTASESISSPDSTPMDSGIAPIAA